MLTRTVAKMTKRPVIPERVTFIGGQKGPWRITRMDTIHGPSLEKVQRLSVTEGLGTALRSSGKWLLRGIASNERYTTRREHQELTARQSQLGRRVATLAALIPITKSASWWSLSQDERRRLFETRSGHIRTGLKYLPAIARRLFHSRDLGGPFDFLTWFEYAPSSESSFNQLVAELRKTEEWTYVEREIDIRLALSTSRGR